MVHKFPLQVGGGVFLKAEHLVYIIIFPITHDILHRVTTKGILAE